MTEHTSGPWSRWPSEPFKIYPASHLGRERGGAVDPERDSQYAQMIAIVYEGSAYTDTHAHRIGPLEAEANARLIAAAPELLAALRWALDYGTFDVAEDNPLHAASLDRARSVIAKALPEAGVHA